MAITVDNNAQDNLVRFDSDDVTGNETILAAPTSPNAIGIDHITFTTAVAGETFFDAGGPEMRFHLPANGGATITFPRTYWFTAATALTVDQTVAGAISGFIQYRIARP